MKTNVLESSIVAYHTDKPKSSVLADRVMAYSLQHRRFTARMASADLGIETATISGIIKPLIDKGDLCRELSRNACAITGNAAHWIYNQNYTNQGDLF